LPKSKRNKSPRRVKCSSSQKDELYLSINICSDAWGDDGSGDSSEDSDGKKGDNDDEGDEGDSADRTDGNNQVRSEVEIEVEVVLAPDSYAVSPSFKI
jgi:hypothetical protein